MSIDSCLREIYMMHTFLVLCHGLAEVMFSICIFFVCDHNNSNSYVKFG